MPKKIKVGKTAKVGVYFTNRADFDMTVQITAIDTPETALDIIQPAEAIIVKGGTIGVTLVEITGLEAAVDASLHISGIATAASGGPYSADQFRTITVVDKTKADEEGEDYE